MKVCFFGPYLMEPMNLLLKKKLELQKIEIIECRQDINDNIFSIIRSYWNLLLKHRTLDYDILILPRWRGAIAIFLAKIISRKPIVYYCNSSQYEMLINEHQMFKLNSIMAKLVWIWNKLCFKWSDMIIKESNADITYNSSIFGILPDKFRRVFLSADESLFPACSFKEPRDTFNILYFGLFLPIHGTKYIIEAAKKLSEHKEIIFKFCGEGITKDETQELARRYNLKNIEFLGFVSQEKLLSHIDESDVCLGIFGNRKKASHFVTNKVYQILSSQKPLITIDSEAIKETGLENEKTCILIPNSNSEKLAEAIVYLKNNVEKRKEIAISGHKFYHEELSLEKTSKVLAKYLEELN